MEEQLEHSQVSNLKPNHTIVVLAEGIQSPENVGSIFRICDAMGVKKLYFSKDCPTTESRKVKRTARSTNHSIPHEYVENVLELIQGYQSKGYKCQALEITSGSISVYKYKFLAEEKYFLLIGSERHGVDADRLSLLNEHIHIPMFGKNSSMNVATSLGIYLSQLCDACN